MEIGNALKAARESRGISLAAAEEKTKIRRKYLEALEAENFGLLPGRVYVKGFIKSYATFLELDSRALVSAYEARAPLEDREDDLPGRRYTHIEKKGGRRSFSIILGLMAVSLIAVLVYLPLAGGGKPFPPGGPRGKVAGENQTAGGGGTAR
jgi:cytoskeletal protein RodZ